MTTRKHPHYYKNVKHLDEIDVYRVLDLFGVTDPCIQHAVKKLLVTGARGAKDFRKDLEEAIVTLQRKVEMLDEDAKAAPTGPLAVLQGLAGAADGRAAGQGLPTILPGMLNGGIAPAKAD